MPERVHSAEAGSVRSADGTRLGFSVVGEGPGVVITHGSLSSGDEWLAVAHALAGQYTCYVMNRRGRGRSDRGPSHSMERECEDIAAVMAVAGPRPHLIAHSYGAVCALEAVSRSLSVARLVLYEPALPFGEGISASALLAYRKALDEGRLDDAVEIGFREFVLLPNAEIRALRGSFVWPAAVRLAPTWLPELEALAALETGVARFRTIAASTLLLTGETTARHHKDAIDALQATLEHARTVVIPDQGHNAHINVPARLASTIAGFLHGEH